MTSRVEQLWGVFVAQDVDRSASVHPLWPGIRRGRPQPVYDDPVDVARYLDFEEKSDAKHEYVDGFIYAMAGASDAHVTIVLNLGAAIHQLLRGRRCKGYLNDMRVEIPAPDGQEGDPSVVYYYPDALITCSESDFSPDAKIIKKEPCAVFEVLSPGSTEMTDRTEKLDNYRTIPTLEQYWLIAQDRLKVIVYARDGTSWRATEYTSPQAVMPLPIESLSIRLEDLYEKVFEI